MNESSVGTAPSSNVACSQRQGGRLLWHDDDVTRQINVHTQTSQATRGERTRFSLDEVDSLALLLDAFWLFRV